MLDMWSDVFASPGWRTTGTKAGTFLITPAGWRPDLRDRFAEEFKLPKDTQRIEAPTPYVWVIGRTKTDGPADYAAVHKIQAGYEVSLLSDFGKTPKPVEVKIDPSVDMKTPPKTQVDTMTAACISLICELSFQPPMSRRADHRADEEIGISRARASASASLRRHKALETAPQDGRN